MGLVGDEKRIQALYYELAIADQSNAPRFDCVWRRSEFTKTYSSVRGSKWPLLNVTLKQTVLKTRSRTLGLSLAVITTVAILTWLSFNLWSRSMKDLEPKRQIALTRATEETSQSRQLVAFALAKPSSSKVATHRPRRTRARDTIVQKAATISSWRSPTALFMESPANPVFKPLPQLNQSVKEMESFLANSELKESKQ